jgi:hypothetical protein
VEEEVEGSDFLVSCCCYCEKECATQCGADREDAASRE